MKVLPLFLFFLNFVSVSTIAYAQEVSLKYSGSGGYSLVERTNLRRYENGKYVGLTSREVRSYISASEAYDESKSDELWFDGNFYVSQDTVRNQKTVNTGIHDSISSIFYIGEDGRMTMFEDKGFPSFRSFPAYTSQSVKIGDSWKSLGERSVDPLGKGVFTKIPILVRYTLVGEEIYKGEEVYRIKAIWQTNYGPQNQDFSGDKELKKATGGHKADIIVLKKTGQPFMILDNVDENFFYSDGKQVSFKGTITMFTEFPAAVDREKLLPALNRIASKVKSSKKRKALGGGSIGAITTVNRKEGGSEDDKKEDGQKTHEDTAETLKTAQEKGAQKENSTKDGENKSENLKTESGLKKNKQDSSKKSKGKSDSESTEKEIQDARKKISEGKSGEQVLDTYDLGVEVQLEAAKNDMIFEDTDNGLRLRVQNINFQADSAELILGTEGSRFDDIAKVLKLAPGSKFLIEGHTASVGKPAGEQSLSLARARKIAGELANRGVPADSFIVRGWGGKKPLMPNDTAAGRAMNRRVEITILE